MMKLLLAIATLTGFMSACGEAAEPPDRAPVSSIEVTAPATTIERGATLPLTAVAFDADGVALPGRTIMWVTSDLAVASVSPAGLVTARRAGTVVISAISEGKADTATLTVHGDAPVDRIDVSPPGHVTLAPAGTQQVVATLYAADGEVLTGRTVTWDSSDAAVATVSASGLVTAVATGTTWIAAACEGQRDALLIRVSAVETPVAWIEIDAGPALTLAPGATRQVAAIAYAADGEILGGRPATWSVDAPAVATVSGIGLVEAHAAGGAVVTAELEGQTARLSVTVATAPRLIVSPAEAAIGVGERVQLVAELRGTASAQSVPILITWSSDHPEVASVDARGVVTGQRVGGATITATRLGVTATAIVSVTSAGAYALSTDPRGSSRVR